MFVLKTTFAINNLASLITEQNVTLNFYDIKSDFVFKLEEFVDYNIVSYNNSLIVAR